MSVEPDAGRIHAFCFVFGKRCHCAFVEPEIQVETQEGDLLSTDQRCPADEGLITDSMNWKMVQCLETVESDGLSEVLEDVAFDADFDMVRFQKRVSYPCDE